MAYHDNRNRGKRRQIPKERVKPLTREWEEQLLQRRTSSLVDSTKHDFYPPLESKPSNSRIFFRKKSNFREEKEPAYLFGKSNVSKVTFPNELSTRSISKNVPNEPRMEEEEYNEPKRMSRGLPVNRNKPNQRLHHESQFTPSNGRVIRPRVTPKRKQIRAYRRLNKSCNDIEPPNFYEKWKGHEAQQFNQNNQERETRFDKKDPFFRIYDKYSKEKKTERNILDKIGEFERSLLHREVFDHADPTVERKYDKKCPYSRLYGIDERLLQKEAFDHNNRIPHEIGKHDRKCLKHRLYGFDEFPEEKRSGKITPRTKNKYGQLCKIRPDKENEVDYQKKDLKSRLYGTPSRPKLPRRDRVGYFSKKLHNPPGVKESQQFRNKFGDYEWNKLYRIPMDKPPRTHFRRQPKRRLYLKDGLPEQEGSFRKLGVGNPKEVKKKKNLNRQLYGHDMWEQLHSKDFLVYQDMMKKRLNQRSLFDVPVRKPQSLTKKIGEYNPWKRNEFQSHQGFKNKSGKYFDVK